ncbi:Cation efflux system protein CusB precursor [Marinobacterium sp. xm-d-420]|uniref:efflux RND transporter periplasmic adaptor subunit n=1 Tax=Marinobacterium sp. xm-d-420 TaxID=2497737 RepID=UPI001568ABA2|nr:efflux RND transporter periplasmic adaptor subunit [Marinobacterium sp. xm-d-420]NRP27345.1 Cation efflux system protein CusB precursor [Marinobacterium sp. xm-d-420]
MSLVKGVFLLLGGAVIGISTLYLINPSALSLAQNEGANEEKPLYWVAPMDPNYRRDGPGKSPMGMDLIPVYASEQASGSLGAGTVEISPELINNLGVRIAKAERGQLQFEVKTVGYLQYNQDSLVHIHPRIDGWIETSFVSSVGDQVTEGQKLYSLYSPALVNAQEELLFALKRQDPRLVKAAEDRLAALQIPQSFIQELKRTGQVSQTVTFYSPASGVVDALNIRDGFYVQPGMTLLSIANLDEIWLDAEVLERQAGLINEGLPVEVRLDFLPGEVFQAQVDYVYPSLDPQTRTLRVRVRLDNSAHALKPNMFAELRVQASDDVSRLLVPKEAVIRGGQQDRVVLALGDGRFKSIAVKTGRRDAQMIEILEGVREGETVVTSAQFLLDSESSKSSDFLRIDAVDQSETERPNQVWVEIKVNGVNAQARKANVDHDPIDAWQWPAMTMDFELDEYLDLDLLSPGLIAHAQISRTPENRYLITDLHIPDGTSDTAKDTTAVSASATDVSQGSASEKSDEKPKKVWVKAEVISLDYSAMKVLARHDAIPEWSWPEMEMEFPLDEFVSVDEMPLNTPLHIEVSRSGSTTYLITDFYVSESN